MGIKTKQLIAALLGLCAIVLLFMLPKVVVRKAGSEPVSENNGHAANSTPTDTISKTVEIPVAETNAINKHKSALNSKSISEKSKSALLDSIYIRFKKLAVYDSAATYKTLLADLSGTDADNIAAGDAWLEAASTQSQQQKKDKYLNQSRNWYNKVLQLKPSDPEVKVKLALTYIDTQNPMQGISLLREVIAANPDNESALYQLGQLSLRSNQVDKAIARFEKLVALRASNTQARFYLAISYKEAGRNKDAIRELKTVVNTEKDPEVKAAATEYLTQLNANTMAQ